MSVCVCVCVCVAGGELPASDLGTLQSCIGQSDDSSVTRVRDVYTRGNLAPEFRTYEHNAVEEIKTSLTDTHAHTCTQHKVLHSLSLLRFKA